MSRPMRGRVRLPRNKELSAAIAPCLGCGPEPALREKADVEAILLDGRRLGGGR